MMRATARSAMARRKLSDIESRRAARLKAAREAALACEAKGEEGRAQYFANVCLLVKMLLATRTTPENVLVQDLYAEVQRQRLPVEEWPQFVHRRMARGEPLELLF
jgi:hypothetical protein